MSKFLRASRAHVPALGLCALSLLTASCGTSSSRRDDSGAPIARAVAPKAPSFENVVSERDASSNPRVMRALGDSRLVALGEGALEDLKGQGKAKPAMPVDLASIPSRYKYTRVRGDGLLVGAPSDAASPSGLLVGFPLEALGLSYVFGGVVTAVSNGESEALGNLKLTGLPSVVVKPLLSEHEGEVYLSLVGCLEACSEGSTRRPVVDIPVLGLADDGRMVYVDLAPLAGNLKIQDIYPSLFDESEPAVVTTKSTRTSLVDHSLDTLVFDITSGMELQEKKGDGSNEGDAKPFELTTRWFLRMENTLDSSYVARPNVPGVGYFTTARSKESRITRFSLTTFGQEAPIHYYVKSVPAEWKPAFDAAFEQWKASFKMLSGRDILTWEHVKPGSELEAGLVTGDPRYNVLEWDVVNEASYGGLGPSISNETSGQLLSAQTLIQGPAILELYSSWYEAWAKARALEQSGRVDEAERVVRAFDRKASRIANPPGAKLRPRVSLNAKLAFRVPAADESLRDPIVQGQFFTFPEDETYESYMNGYFQDMVAHELGHNLGLRHNFRGSLGRAGELPEGRVSVSVMEYLDRNFRNRSRVGEHDVMAIAYGYTGLAPSRTDLFCTDGDAAGLDPQGDTLRYASPECSSNDGGIDGYGYHRAQVVKGVDLLLAPHLEGASPWTPEELFGRFASASTGMLAYAKAASDTFSTWTNWTGKPGLPTRPVSAKRAREFVVADFQDAACSLGRLDAALERKGDAVAKTATLEKVRSQLEFVLEFARGTAGLSDDALAACREALAEVEKRLKP